MRTPLRQRIRSAWNMLFDQHRQEFLSGADMGRPALSGVNVNGNSAMTFSAFFSGVQQISQTVASLPLPVFTRTGESSRERARKHPLYPILNTRTNHWMTSFMWRETMTHHAIVFGNGYSFIIKSRNEDILGMQLMNPESTWPEVKDDEIIYKHRNRDGSITEFPREWIFHLPGFGFDGIKGYSLLTVARESIGMGLAMQEFTARFYGQGTHIGGILQRPAGSTKLSKEAAERLAEEFAQKYAGLGNTYRVALLEEGITFEPSGMPLKDAEFLGSKQFSIQDVARFLNMPPHKLKDLSRATFSNIEQEQLSYLTDTIRPWLVRWETAINANLIKQSEQETVFAEHIADAILRADIVTRYGAYHIARNDGIITADEWRKFENWNPQPGGVGEKILINGNMKEVDEFVNETNKQRQAEAAAALEKEQGNAGSKE